MISALYFSPLALKNSIAAVRSQTSRVKAALRPMIWRILASIFTRSSGVNGSSRAKS